MLDEHVRRHNEDVGIFVPEAQLDAVAYPAHFCSTATGSCGSSMLSARRSGAGERAMVLEEGFGVEAAPVSVVQEARSQALSVRAWTDVASYRPWLRFRLNLQITVAEGLPPTSARIRSCDVASK